MLLSVVVGVASADTGPVEKAVLVALAGALIWLASLARRIGRGQGVHRTEANF